MKRFVFGALLAAALTLRWLYPVWYALPVNHTLGSYPIWQPPSITHNNPYIDYWQTIAWSVVIVLLWFGLRKFWDRLHRGKPLVRR